MFLKPVSTCALPRCRPLVMSDVLVMIFASPLPETKSQHEFSCLKLQGRRERDRFRSSNAKINIFTFNTQTLRTDDYTNRLVEELGNIKWHVVDYVKQREEGMGLENFQRGHGCMIQN